MATLSTRKELFRTPSTKDKLTLFQHLFDAQTLDTDASLALLNLVHRELGYGEEYDRTLYKNYAETIEALRFYMSDVLEEVVEEWRRR